MILWPHPGQDLLALAGQKPGQGGPIAAGPLNPPGLHLALRRHQVRQDEERRTAGDLWQDFGLVFPTRSDGPWSRATFSRMCTGRFSSELDCPGHLHTLRLTAATLLLAEGEHPKVVQELLGHAQVSITLDRYSHMTPRLMSNAAALMDRLLDGEEPGSQTPDSS